MLFMLLLIRGLCREQSIDLPVGSCPNFRSSFDKRPFSRYEFHAFNDRLRFRDDARSSIRCTVVPVNIAIRLPNIRARGAARVSAISRRRRLRRWCRRTLAVGDRRRDEFVAGAEMISIAGRLVAVVELVREVRRVVACSTAGSVFSCAQTMALDAAFADTLGAVPGYANCVAIAMRCGRSLAFTMAKAFSVAPTSP